MDSRYNSSFVPPTRAPSAAPSMAASDLTFYTARNQFYDVETLDEEEPSPPPQKRVTSSRNSHRRRGSRASIDRPKSSQPIKRHDSGYGSNGIGSNGYNSNVVSPRPSVSQYRPATANHARRPSTNALNGVQQNRTGPSTRRRIPKSYQAANDEADLHLARPVTSARHSSTFFHFPATTNDPLALPPRRDFNSHAAAQYRARSRSRHTDYRTIDGSSGGFGGWIKRTFGCMSAKEPQGSVRHYRPSMDEDMYYEEEEKRAPHPQGWQGQPLKVKHY